VETLALALFMCLIPVSDSTRPSMGFAEIGSDRSSRRSTMIRRCRDLVQRRLGGAGPICVLVPFATAGTLFANGSTVIGAVVLLTAMPVTWLGGLWVVPRSHDAYARKMTHLLETTFADSREASHKQVMRLREVTAAVDALQPPDQYADLHTRIRGIMEQIDGIDRSPAMLVESTTRIVALRRELTELRNRLDGCSSVPYVRDLIDALDAREAITTETPQSVQGPLYRQREALARLRVPQSWQKVHETYERELAGFLAAQDRYYAAAREGNSEESEQAAVALSGRAREFRELCKLYARALHEHYTGRAVNEPAEPCDARPRRQQTAER
jgi:hypothetical protein